jgi:hypothetical protein
MVWYETTERETTMNMSIDIHSVSAEETSVKVTDYSNFATVRVKIGGSTITLYTASVEEARAVLSAFVMPELANA